MGAVYYFNYLPGVSIMSTIREQSETNSLASTPILTHSEPCESPESDLYLDFSKDSNLIHLPDECRDYVNDLKQSVYNMRKQILSQNRYIEELSFKFENSLDTIVELKDEIRRLENDVKSWRIKAKSHELSSSMLEHNVDELRDAIVLLRKENIENVELEHEIHQMPYFMTPAEEKEGSQSNIIKDYVGKPLQKQWRKRSTLNERGDPEINIADNWIKVTTETSKSVTCLQQSKKRPTKNQSSPSFNLDLRSIKQRPIDPTFTLINRPGLPSLKLPPKQLPRLKIQRHQQWQQPMSTPSKPITHQIRNSTPRPSSLTDILAQSNSLSRSGTKTNKYTHSLRISGFTPENPLPSLGQGVVGRRPYT